MKILGIETSCDDTCASIIEVRNEKFHILSNIVSSQIEIHKEWGGVYPILARREHQKNLTDVLKTSLKKSNLLKKKTIKKKIDFPEEVLKKESHLIDNLRKFLEEYEKPEINLIAVTNGPGLEPSLWTGINFSKALSIYWDIPIIPINHIEAHLNISFFALNKNILELNIDANSFPAIGLIVSGGHTQLILIKKFGKYKLIGETRDDAAGECFDKTARILGLDFPGGPEISKKADLFKGKKEIHLPRPMINYKNYDFSFSGLKTAVLYHNQKVKEKNENYINEMSHEIQQSIIDVLLSKTISAAKKYEAKNIILGGGVTANKELQKQMIAKADSEFKVLLPPHGTHMDNALMIAVTAYFKRNKKTKKDLNKIKANSNLKI